MEKEEAVEVERNIRKNISLSPKMDAMVREIKAEKGYKTFVAVIELAISELYGQVFKDYIMARKFQSGKTPEEKAEATLRAMQIKKQREQDSLMAIAAELGGRLSGPEGDKRVKYFTYDKSNRYEQELPLEMMTKELVVSQYFPDKETVLRRQAEGKVNYDPKSIN